MTTSIFPSVSAASSEADFLDLLQETVASATTTDSIITAVLFIENKYGLKLQGSEFQPNEKPFF
jgi:hypothetical protein